MTNETRLAPVFTAYDFEIHLQPDQAVMQVQLRATIRNAGDAPLSTLPLQLGSSLHFEHIRMDGQASPLRFAVHSCATAVAPGSRSAGDVRDRLFRDN
jgi:hypothetical protein